MSVRPGMHAATAFATGMDADAQAFACHQFGRARHQSDGCSTERQAGAWVNNREHGRTSAPYQAPPPKTGMLTWDGRGAAAALYATHWWHRDEVRAITYHGRCEETEE